MSKVGGVRRYLKTETKVPRQLPRNVMGLIIHMSQQDVYLS